MINNILQICPLADLEIFPGGSTHKILIIMSKVLAMGNALVDILIRLDDDTMLSEFKLDKGSMQLINKDMVDLITMRTQNLEKVKVSGGSASNTIHALAKLGVETGMIGKIGEDETGLFFKEDMEMNHIDACLLSSETLSGRAMTFISPDSERTFGTFLGAAVELTDADLNEELFRGYSYFHIEGYLVQNNKLIEKALRLAKEAGLKISIDMASYNVVEENLDFLKKMVNKYVDIAFLNEEEAQAFTGKQPEEALHDVARECEIAVVKLGKQGSLIKRKDEIISVPGIEVTPKDTTGAGDAYAAGFIYGLIRNLPLQKCGEISSLIAGHVVTVIGAKLDSKHWSELKEKIQEIVNN